MKGLVYLLVAVDDEGCEKYKIGITKNNIERRVAQLQTGSAAKINVINTYESTNYKLVEQWLHGKYFMSKTTSGNEWFNLTTDQLNNFTSECEKAEEVFKMMLKENHFFKKR